MLYDETANATVRIESGNSRGSGFHFIRSDIIITNHHVVDNGQPTRAITENGLIMPLQLVEYSPSNQQDFAIFKVIGDVPVDRHVLQPKVFHQFLRGTEILFSGFPHGIPHLLIQKAIVSGFLADKVFYVDGSVNGGNSGGPIIDVADGSIVGIVTQRRFLVPQDLNDLRVAAERLVAHSQATASQGTVQIMGIDFGQFSAMMAQSMLLIREVLELNANAGIGIGFSIEFVTNKCNELGITAD